MRRGLLLVVALCLSGCAHQVVLDSEPSGAMMYVDDVQMGEGPVTYDETTGWETLVEVRAEKPGYTPQTVLVKQSEWSTPVVMCSLGSFLLCGWTGIGLGSLAGLAFARQMPDRVVVPLARAPAAKDPFAQQPASPTPTTNGADGGDAPDGMLR